MGYYYPNHMQVRAYLTLLFPAGERVHAHHGLDTLVWRVWIKANSPTTSTTHPPLRLLLLPSPLFIFVRVNTQNEEHDSSSHCGLWRAYCCAESFFPSYLRRE